MFYQEVPAIPVLLSALESPSLLVSRRSLLARADPEDRGNLGDPRVLELQGCPHRPDIGTLCGFRSKRSKSTVKIVQFLFCCFNSW